MKIVPIDVCADRHTLTPVARAHIARRAPLRCVTAWRAGALDRLTYLPMSGYLIFTGCANRSLVWCLGCWRKGDPVRGRRHIGVGSSGRRITASHAVRARVVHVIGVWWDRCWAQPSTELVAAYGLLDPIRIDKRPYVVLLLWRGGRWDYAGVPESKVGLDTWGLSGSLAWAIVSASIVVRAVVQVRPVSEIGNRVVPVGLAALPALFGVGSLGLTRYVSVIPGLSDLG